MPFYKYYCDKCDEVFEVFLKVEERKSIYNCPICDKESKRDIKDYGTSVSVKCNGFCGKVNSN